MLPTDAAWPASARSPALAPGRTARSVTKPMAKTARPAASQPAKMRASMMAMTSCRASAPAISAGMAK